MADRPATPTLSRILSDPQTCPDFSKKSHATFPSPVSKNFSSNHLILSSPFPPLLISINSIDSRLREKKKENTGSRFSNDCVSIKSVDIQDRFDPGPQFLQLAWTEERRDREEGCWMQRAGSTWDAEEAPLVERQRRAKENRGGIEEREDGG